MVQLHWGGGTPTFLDAAQLARLHAAFARAFRIAPDAEQSIEIHPPVTTFEQLEVLRGCGFNRVSMGVQDFDTRVQLAVNRIQPFTQTQALVVRARELGFKSVNVDLMYGLPHQSVESFDVTLDRIAELRPDRIALFGYAHLPQLKPHQKLIPAEALPLPSQRLAIFESAVERLFALGYRHIGLDHFALPSDDLALAQDAGTLRRDFMGYTTCAESELLAFGASAISDLGGAYLQNAKGVKGYIDAISEGRTAVDRGALLSRDDLQRRTIIQALFCVRELDTRRLGEKLGIRFDDAFAPELARLAALAKGWPGGALAGPDSHHPARPGVPAPHRRGLRRLPARARGRPHRDVQGDLRRKREAAPRIEPGRREEFRRCLLARAHERASRRLRGGHRSQRRQSQAPGHEHRDPEVLESHGRPQFDGAGGGALGLPALIHTPSVMASASLTSAPNDGIAEPGLNFCGSRIHAAMRSGPLVGSRPAAARLA